MSKSHSASARNIIQEHLTTSHPTALHRQFELAKTLYDTKRYDESRVAFRELTHSSDYAARGFYGLGLIEYALGHLDEAANYFRIVLVSHDPTDANSFYYLGLIAEKHGNAREAQALYRKALASNPRHASAKGRLLQRYPSSDGDAIQRASHRPPVSALAVDQHTRARWQDWVTSEIGGAEARVEAATAAAVAVLERPEGPDAAMAAARQAAYRWDQSEFRRFPQPDDGKVIRGRVKAIRWSREKANTVIIRGRWMGRPAWAVMTFQLERVASDGTPLPSVPVKLYGPTFDGALANGDIVEVDGPWAAGQVLVAREVRSAQLSGKTLIRCKGSFVTSTLVSALLLLLFFAYAAFVLAH